MTDRKSGLIARHWGASLAAIVLLSGCGGGGGGTVSTPGPTPSPSPSPSPTPTPTPSSSFTTAEYNRSDGPQMHDAIPAWQSGATGQGQTIAIIDTGIDSDSPEFAGRIHANSRDVVSNRGIDGEDDHGTHVALVAAAARDNTGIMGIAWNATILALRADDPGSCPTVEGCSFLDQNIAAGVDQAIASGAKVINISLGGDPPLQVMRDAIARAAAAGIVVVVSGGNGGDGSDPGIDPNQPDPFASGLVDAGNGNVIIVGSVNVSGQISNFSNRAGSYASSYITALGEDVCCIYENGQMLITTSGGQQFVTVFSGTSFSAPQVSGAVALLAQAFPNLTATQIVQIILESATDAGATGTDAVYGHGILDIAAAFAPQGTTSLAGSTALIPLGDDTAIGSSAMGDALGGQGPLSTIVLDKYARAYSYNLARGFRGAQQREDLYAAVAQRGRQVSGESKGLALAFTLDGRGAAAGLGWSRQLSLTAEDAEQARVLAGRIAMKLAPDTQVSFGFAQGADGLVAQLQGQHRPAFMIADAPQADRGFLGKSTASMALRQQFGGWGVTLSAEEGEAWLGDYRKAAGRLGLAREEFGVRSFGASVDRSLGSLETVLGLTWLAEDRTVLGGYFHQALGAGGADTLFIDAGAGLALGSDWRIGANYRQGYTRARHGGMIASGSGFTSNAWSLDLARYGLLQQDDSLAFRIAQPLRVSSGGLLLNLPLSYDYASASASYGLVPLSLAPSGRELTGELAWHGRLGNGSAAASLFYRHEPGNYAAAPADAGLAISWGLDF